MKKTFSSKRNYELAKLYHINTFFNKNSHQELAFRSFPESNVEKEHYVIKSHKLLVDTDIMSDVTLLHSLKERHSADKFNKESLSFKEISNIFHFSYGYLDSKRRPVPSGGGRYPVYLYLAVFDIEGLEKGIYYYNATQNRFELILMGDFRSEISTNSLYPDKIEQSSCVIINVCSLTDSCSKYGDVGYKLMCMDLGHISQNIYLLSVANQLKCRAILGVYNQFFNDLLNLNDLEESAYLIHVIGK